MKLIILIAALACTVACSPMRYSLDYPDVPNIEEVDPGVWRSGQITADAGWDTIARLAEGRHVFVVKLNFDLEGSDAGADARGMAVQYEPIQPEGDQDVWDDVKGLFMRPDPNRVANAVSTLCLCHAYAGDSMCLVHCTHGQDRTGLVVGEYRVACDGWSKRDAYGEMLAHNYHPEIVGLQTAWMQFQP